MHPATNPRPRCSSSFKGRCTVQPFSPKGGLNHAREAGGAGRSGAGRRRGKTGVAGQKQGGARPGKAGLGKAGQRRGGTKAVQGRGKGGARAGQGKAGAKAGQRQGKTGQGRGQKSGANARQKARQKAKKVKRRGGTRGRIRGCRRSSGLRRSGCPPAGRAPPTGGGPAPWRRCGWCYPRRGRASSGGRRVMPPEKCREWDSLCRAKPNRTRRHHTRHRGAGQWPQSLIDSTTALKPVPPLTAQR
eukprot:SAG11_NODE_187_length_13061_cov_10.715322_6_plen_245_part_00